VGSILTYQIFIEILQFSSGKSQFKKVKTGLHKSLFINVRVNKKEEVGKV